MAKFRVWFGSFSITVEAHDIIGACHMAVNETGRMYADITECYNIAWINE